MASEYKSSDGERNEDTKQDDETSEYTSEEHEEEGEEELEEGENNGLQNIRGSISCHPLDTELGSPISP